MATRTKAQRQASAKKAAATRQRNEATSALDQASSTAKGAVTGSRQCRQAGRHCGAQGRQVGRECRDRCQALELGPCQMQKPAFRRAFRIPKSSVAPSEQE